MFQALFEVTMNKVAFRIHVGEGDWTAKARY